MWITEFGLRGFTNLHADDLTLNAIDLTEKRIKSHDLNAELSVQNAENTSFQDTSFDHINCQGVIHHTPNTASCVREIARILNKDGTAVISVYHRNIFLRLWPLLRPLGILLSSCGAKLRGRGRENIFRKSNVDDIVRLYDGSENPLGKAYSKKAFTKLLSPYFDIEEVFFHFFPARSLPFKIPKFLHRFLDRRLGFMIFATLRKKCVK
jgi:ubiquinone/menaquinone biosynthesis C-methylase UbiE